jgi:hypothetical protein
MNDVNLDCQNKTTISSLSQNKPYVNHRVKCNVDFSDSINHVSDYEKEPLTERTIPVEKGNNKKNSLSEAKNDDDAVISKYLDEKLDLIAEFFLDRILEKLALEDKESSSLKNITERITV